MVDTTLPSWLIELRRREIVERVKNDPRTSEEYLLGVSTAVIFNEVIRAGRANFDEPWQHLTPDDRALLYAYFNQVGHIEELVAAFRMLFEDYSLDDPIVIDLGCGPFTGGLALSAVLGPERKLTYVGLDTATAMRTLGERLAVAAEGTGRSFVSSRHWTDSLSAMTSSWPHSLGWRPVLVVVSYLLASESLDPVEIVAELTALLNRIGHGPVLLLCTNSTDTRAGAKFPAFREELQRTGFKLEADDVGSLRIARWQATKQRNFRYALFHRQRLVTLKLGEK